MMEALCDECGRVFAAAPQACQDGEIETTFFICAHCGHEYIVCRTDPGIRALQEQTDRQRQRNNGRFQRGELNRWHIGHMRRKMNLLRGRLDAMNRAE